MYPTEVTVDYGVLERNFRSIQAWGPGVHLAPIVKSDAYGHGLEGSGCAFLHGGAERLAVFRIEEAEALRRAGLECPIWVLMGALPCEVEKAVWLDVTLVVYDLWQAEALSRVAVLANRQVEIHLAVDTGMGRLGILPSQVPEMVKKLRALPNLQLRGICSHIAKAADPGHEVTQAQLAAFRAALKFLPEDCTENHLCASDAWMNGLAPELHYARPGICLYASYTPKGMATPITRGAMTLKTRIVSLKELPSGSTISYGCVRHLERKSRIGVVPLGYEDGYVRQLSDRAFALVRGRRVPVMGTICMSMTMLDLTDVPGASVDDEVVFLGRQGAQEIEIHELAALAGTTPHEILCAIGKHRHD